MTTWSALYTRPDLLAISESIMSQCDYVQVVLRAYLVQQETPSRARPADRVLALDLQQQQVNIDQIRAANLLAAGRRLQRSPEALKLAKIQSLPTLCR